MNFRPLIIVFLVILAVFSIVVTTTIGVAEISFMNVVRMVINKITYFGQFIQEDWPSTWETIIFNMRLPRVVLGFIVGASLSIAGAAFQGLLRNPLADPYTIGVSSGAALGATLAMFIQNSYGLSFFGGIPFFAFLGALVALFFVYNLSRVGNSIPVVTLLLAGVVVSSFLSAVISLLMLSSGEQIRGIYFWLVGGLSMKTWSHVIMVLPYVIIGSSVIFYWSRDLNVILLGEEAASNLGIEVDRVKKIILVAASLITGAVVSVSGMIGFVGLIIPHAVRMIVGPDHRILIPTSALVGGIYLIWVDSLARTMMAPIEMPVGIITAFLGAPFFIYLLRSKRKEFRF
ncbi:FecCD family ABC transporter permease [Candidatus Contubernalis alkaliaceticus]|uniref:FecCD family ABC transporter permease n=1 Tax=Candidatus Contubernalis alkaliaceticus TaxID=338645 RepID=UPI001F4C0B05|nr:iron chelate uptake ABC transporter family permease subunit [Candidatus Contubernalis alkalaceticus]UNC92503.1 iron chelate uptake ABC transporter family permease subunit [Candidatus Contubernalis alkalaceticus]